MAVIGVSILGFGIQGCGFRVSGSRLQGITSGLPRGPIGDSTVVLEYKVWGLGLSVGLQGGVSPRP